VKTREGLIAVALAAGTFLLFLPVRHNEFLNWDDLTYIANNDHVRGGLTWEGFKWAFTHSYSANWHPLTWLSHALDCQLYGLGPAGHHLTNAVFHAVNAALLFLLLGALTGFVWRSAFVAALFAVHPLHVESVAWVAERKDVLSTFFFLLTLMAYVRYARSFNRARSRQPSLAHGPSILSDETESNSCTPANTKKWYMLALVCFALGLMSKPMLVTVPFVLFLLDFWPLKRISLASMQPFTGAAPRLVTEKIPFFVLTLASCVVTFLAQRKSGAVASFEQLSLSTRLGNATVAYVEYLAKCFWPTNLSPFYPHPQRWDGLVVAASLGLLAAITVAAWVSRQRYPYLAMGWLWFLGTLVPVIGIVQVGSQAFADRYTYIPLIGVMVAVTWLVSDLALATAPDSAAARSGSRQPASPQPRKPSRARVLAVAGMIVVAALAWQTNAQLVYWHDTETLFKRALTLAPQSVQALYGLGTSLIDAGKVEEGLPLVKEAVRLQPRYPEALGTLANTLDGQGKYAEALEFYEAALQAQPDHAGVLNNLAWFRATCPNAAFRNGAEAVRLAKQACELTRYGTPLFIGTLAAAQAEAGDFAAAIATGQRAAAAADGLRLQQLAAKNRELVELYRQGKTAAGGK
jgi:tetratricopeptide (TPR) repeat protein